jgi:ABC-type phosphate/phosphonate transport system substrate-binding protein
VLLRIGARDLRVIESWGPFAIQPTIVRVALDASAKARVANALLTLHERHSLEPFGFRRFVAPDERLYC